MTTEDNKRLFKDFIQEMVDKGNVDAIGRFASPDLTEHARLPPGYKADLDGIKHLFADIKKAFPDLRVDFELLVAEGDLVVANMIWSGTNKGEFLGNPPTDRKVEFSVIDIVRIEGGKITEHWGLTDETAMMQQMGAMPEGMTAQQ